MDATERARRLRRDQTEAERRLCYRLRDRRLGGWKFRRQIPADRYILDFLCKEAALAIELDGGQHSELRADYDRARTERLERLGLRVIRFWNVDVLTNIDGVLDVILIACEEGAGRSERPVWSD